MRNAKFDCVTCYANSNKNPTRTVRYRSLSGHHATTWCTLLLEPTSTWNSRAMGATQNPRGPRSGSPSSGSTSGGTDGPERAAEPTPLAGALAGARALPRCLLICHLGRREIRESPTGRLLTASSPAPMCRQHCDTERVRKIRREGICSQRAARPRRVDNTATLRESERSNGKGCAHSEQPGPQVSPASG